MTDPEIATAKESLRILTEWIIDVGVAIRSGNVGDRITAVEQSGMLIEELTKYADEED